MKHLFSFPLPLTLGTGSRAKPGLDPYIEYMLNEVLIKLSVRNGFLTNHKVLSNFLQLGTLGISGHQIKGCASQKDK